MQHQPLERQAGAQQLVMYVPQAHHLLAAPDGSVLGWDDERTVPIRPPQAEADYTASVSPTAPIADLDPVEVSRLRGVARGNLSQLPDLDLLRELGLITRAGGKIGRGVVRGRAAKSGPPSPRCCCSAPPTP